MAIASANNQAPGGQAGVAEEVAGATTWLTVREAAAHLRRSEVALRHLLARGRLRYFQDGAHGPIRFRRDDLDHFVEAGVHEAIPIARATAKRRGRRAHRGKRQPGRGLRDMLRQMRGT